MVEEVSWRASLQLPRFNCQDFQSGFYALITLAARFFLLGLLTLHALKRGKTHETYDLASRRQRCEGKPVFRPNESRALSSPHPAGIGYMLHVDIHNPGRHFLGSFIKEDRTMSIPTTFKIWGQKFQQNSSVWGPLLLWFCGVLILVVIMVSFARS